MPHFSTQNIHSTCNPCENVPLKLPIICHCFLSDGHMEIQVNKIPNAFIVSAYNFLLMVKLSPFFLKP